MRARARRAQGGRVIDVQHLTKRYGATTAVDDLTFRAEPGQVTGFLGPNGAGKSTTLRLLLGTATATSGTARIAGRRYSDLPHPARTVGALLDPAAGYPGRSARTHLRCLATAAGTPLSRVDAVLAETGLADVARRRLGALSMGLRQRLGLAAALLGDPRVLVLDEPGNGLDVHGARWLRDLLRRLAGEGRTVFVSSHLMSELERTADRLVVVAGGRLLAATTPAELTARTGTATLEDAYLALVTAGPVLA